MTSCWNCHCRVDEALLMACHHHLCLSCGCARLEGEKGVRCTCGTHTQLTDDAYQCLVAQNCHNASLCKPEACGRQSPFPSPRNGNPYAAAQCVPTVHVTHNHAMPSGENMGASKRTMALRWCPLHPEETMNFWCVDCRVFICPECGMVGQHHGHNFRTLRQQAAEVQQQLHSSIAALNAYAREAGREFEKIDSQSRGVEMMMNNSKKALRKQVQRITRDLELYQENMERAYSHAAEQCFGVLTRACDAAIRAEENYRMHADDISVAIASEESELVEWYGKTKDTIDTLSKEPPRFLDYWPYLESTPAELAILWDGEPLLSTKIPKLMSRDVPEANGQGPRRHDGGMNGNRSSSPARHT
eukprot:GEMP01036063.1.p1 GENE.GEMP01036063.1~~GEMP01036063.1.p1  ORF type:complete len:366 (-),score=55.06 GEMP01036063.1:932-2008(-)